jgi:tetratricopeptide (TPR) repeat protein
MAEISLRAYIKELDDLIERDQLDEVIAHCRHILQTYPKHLDVYRLLGKAYLEAKRYGDAADIFQRVLSAIPDDFVAHVGMAIVREDEGNLDAAIWHMERAFETNPSNPAIQQELRRLIGRRDGLEPNKVRLTRGALARMYAHGELFPQAIAELRSALQEDADRPDLQVLLADMYWRTGQRTEAADVCQRILDSLPFCREANRILAAALQAEGRAEDAITYHRRLASLEPYAALVETAMDDASRVEANAVRIEKLAWVPGQPVPGGDGGQPDWAASLGIDARPEVPKPPSAKRPSWLESLESETAAARQPAAPPPQREAAPEPVPPPPSVSAPSSSSPATESAEGAIPDWMKGAGWSESRGEAVEGPVSFSESELEALDAGAPPPQEGELAPADIPDWLKDIAPTEGLTPSPEPPPAVVPEAATPDNAWLGAGAEVVSEGEGPRLPPGWGTPPPARESDQSEPPTPAPAVPTWMEEAAPGATETIVTWLGDRSKEALGRPVKAEPAEPIPEPIGEPEPDLTFDKASLPAGVPDWLAEEVSWGQSEQVPAPSDEEKAPTEPEGPSWLSGVAAAAAESESAQPEGLPWMKAEEEEPIQAGMYAEEPEEPATPAAEVPAWIKAIAASGADEEVPAAAEVPQPEWLRESEMPPAEEAGREGLDWLRTLAEAEAEPSIASTPSATEEPPAAAPAESLAWLRDLAEAEPPSPPDEGKPEEEPEAPGWLRGIAEERPARSALSRSSAPEWMRGIAEPEPEPAAEISEEATLDWMRGIAEAQAPAPEASSEIPEPAALTPIDFPEVTPTPPGETPEWLSLLGPPEVPPGETPTGEWLRTLEAEGAPTAGAAPTLPPGEGIPGMGAASDDALDDEQVFQWLEGLAARQESEVAQPAAPPEPPSPVAPSPAGPPPPLAPVAAAPLLAPPPEEGMEWLEKLAADRGVEAPQAPAPAPPGVPSPEVPDWLKELVAEAPPAPASTKPPEPPTPPSPPADSEETLPALPEWMIPSPLEETEPAIPLPPVQQTAPEPPMPVAETPAASPPPMEELSETWVPPWEGLEIETPEEAPPEPAESVWKPVLPSDETVYIPPRRPSRTDETLLRRPLPSAEPPIAREEPAPEPPQTIRPGPPVAPEPVRSPVGDQEDEIPDWLRTPIPYIPPTAKPPVPAEAEPALESAFEPEPAVPAPVPAEPVFESTFKPEPFAPAPIPAELVPSEPEEAAPPPPVVTEPVAATPAPVEVPVPEEAVPAPAPQPREAPLPQAEAPPPIVEPRFVEPAPVPAPAPVESRRVDAVPPAIPPAAAAVPARPARAGRGRADPGQHLENARKALATGDYPRAASSYGALIKRNFDVQAIADELRLALDRNPQAAVLWQTLGDAYMKGGRLQDAIEAYRRGMEAA